MSLVRSQADAPMPEENGDHNLNISERNLVSSNTPATGESATNFPRHDNTVTIEEQAQENAQVTELAMKLRQLDKTGSAVGRLLHENVPFSQYEEQVANFVRLRAKVKGREFLGTNHGHSAEEVTFIDDFFASIKDRPVTAAFVESGYSPQNNLSLWLEQHGYAIPREPTGMIIDMREVIDRATALGVPVRNMDLRHNPSAISHAIEKLGLERAVQAINWDLQLQALDTAIKFDKSKIPQAIIDLVRESGHDISMETVMAMTQERDFFRDDDYFTDSEREEYMAQQIEGENIIVAAHSAHVSALLEKTVGDQTIDDIHFFVDRGKIDKVLLEGKRNELAAIVKEESKKEN